MGLPLVPAVSPTRSVPYRTAVAAVVARDHLGVCARLAPAEWPINAPGALTSMVDELSIEPAEVDLMLDLGFDTSDLAAVADGRRRPPVVHCVSKLGQAHWRTRAVEAERLGRALEQISELLDKLRRAAAKPRSGEGGGRRGRDRVCCQGRCDRLPARGVRLPLQQASRAVEQRRPLAR